MKLLSIAEAQKHLAAICDAAVAGEVIRLRLANGALLELTRVSEIPPVPALSDQQLEACYDDPDWAAFENRCAKAND